MKKLGCASCGGTKKMAKGGTTKSVSISKRGAGVVKETKGDTNQKMGIYGVAQTGPTGPNNSGIATMKKGGTKKPLVKAQYGKVKAGPLSEEDTKAANAFNTKALKSPSFLARQSFDKSGIESHINAGNNFVRQNKNFNTEKVANNFSNENSTNDNWKGVPYKKKGGAVKEHPITTFRKADEARKAVVMKSLSNFKKK